MWREKGKESSTYFQLYYQQSHRSSGLRFWSEGFQGTTPVSCNARNRLPLSALFSGFFLVLVTEGHCVEKKSRAQVFQKWSCYDSFALQNTVWEKLYSWESEPNTNAAKCIFQRAMTRPSFFSVCFHSFDLCWFLPCHGRLPHRWHVELSSFVTKSSTNVSRWKECVQSTCYYQIQVKRNEHIKFKTLH